MDILLFGIQGSGKGTQSQVIAQKFQMKIFETGAELRKLAKLSTPLGAKVKSIIEAGQLVPNDVVMEIVENFMQEIGPDQPVLFDGIPRKKIQAHTLNELLQKKQRNFLAVLINLSKEEALRRLTTRRICENCKTVYPAFYEKENCEKCGGRLVTRADDNPESIKNRLDAYEAETLPVIEEYRQQGKIIEINGQQSIEKVSSDIIQTLSKKLPQ